MQRQWKVRGTQRLETIKIHHRDNIMTWVTMTWVELWERKWRGWLNVPTLQNTHRQPLPIRGCKTELKTVEKERERDRNVEKDWSTEPTTRQGQQIHNTHKYEYAFFNLYCLFFLKFEIRHFVLFQFLK